MKVNTNEPVLFNNIEVKNYMRVLVSFHGEKRKSIPFVGYRPDAVFYKEYWGITFLEMDVNDFGVLGNAVITFTFVESHIDEVFIGQEFSIREGANEVAIATITEIIKID